MSRGFRPRARALLAAAALSMAVLSVSASPAAIASGPCTDVEIVGLRGSSEPYYGDDGQVVDLGMGRLLAPVAESIIGSLSGSLTVGIHGLPYAAYDAIVGQLNGRYYSSKKGGSRMLHDYLESRGEECKSTRFVVMGYSQGAHAAGDQLAVEPKAVSDRVAALVMFGDPRFNPEAPYAWGSFNPTQHGIAGARSLGDFSEWGRTRVFSFCRENDLVCQGPGWDHQTASHDAVRYVADYSHLVGGLVRRSLGLKVPSKVPLDLAFVIDSTRSMESTIDGVRNAVAAMARGLAANSSDFRVGLVDYKDTDQDDEYAARVDLNLTPDTEALVASLDGLIADGGGDTPEAVFSGVMTAINGMAWRPGSRRALVVVGDAPAKDPEPVTGYTHASVVAAANRIAASSVRRNIAADDPFNIYSMSVGSDFLDGFSELADDTGGQSFLLDDSGSVSADVVSSVDALGSGISVSLAMPDAPPVGVSVGLVANASYPNGPIERFEWDFDGDGTIDQTSTEGRIEHVFPEPFEGHASVTAIAGDGRRASARADFRVAESDVTEPSAPLDLRISAVGRDRRSIQVRWDPPEDSGGGSLGGYWLEVADEDSGDLIASASFDSDGSVFTTERLPIGRYRATLRAFNESGLGNVAVAFADVRAVDLIPVAVAGARAVLRGSSVRLTYRLSESANEVDSYVFAGHRLKSRRARVPAGRNAFALRLDPESRSRLRKARRLRRKVGFTWKASLVDSAGNRTTRSFRFAFR